MKKKTVAETKAPRTGISREVLALVALVVLCLVVYGRCVTFEHTLYDDPNIIFENPQVMAGLTWDSIKWAVLNPNFGLYMPLPTLTFMLDRNLFGDWAGGYHGMTLLWHILCVSAFYWVMRRLTGNFAAVFAAALLAAVHPVQAMTINWISARNEIMPAFFMLLSVEMYRRYCGHGQNGRNGQGSTHRWLAWAASVGFMFLGIMSKQGIVMLPVVLLLLDYWPLGRIEISFRAPLRTLGRMTVLTLEKLPWFAMSGLGVFLAIYGKRDFGAFQGETLLSPLDNVGFALTAYIRYLFHIIYPERYIMAFSASGPGPTWWMIGGAAMLLSGICIFALAQLHKRPWVIVFWGWFVLFLLPVSGLVRYAAESIALRYLYAPGMGLYLLAGFGLFEASRRIAGDCSENKFGTQGLSQASEARRDCPSLPNGHTFIVYGGGESLMKNCARLFWIVVALLTLVSGLLAFRQSGFWRNSEALAQRALVITDGTNAMAHNHLGVLRGRQGLNQQAFAHLRRAMELEPDRLPWKINYAISLNRQQRYPETLDLVKPLLDKQPESVTWLNLYGGALTGLMRFEEAMPYLLRALEIEPRHVPSLYNLGLCLQYLGRTEEACSYFRKALEIQPSHQAARAAQEKCEG